MRDDPTLRQNDFYATWFKDTDWFSELVLTYLLGNLENESTNHVTIIERSFM